MPHKRIHQYRGGHNETHGGVTINIDSNYLDLRRGSAAPPARPSCGVRIDFTIYKALSIGSAGEQVTAAHCLLRKRGFYDGELSAPYSRATNRAVLAFQQARTLTAVSGMTPRTWTAILSQGRSPVLKHGSAGHAVRRVQRALNAATGSALSVTGVFDSRVTSAVLAYQQRRRLPRTGVVAGDTWAQLQAGRI